MAAPKTAWQTPISDPPTSAEINARSDEIVNVTMSQTLTVTDALDQRLTTVEGKLTSPDPATETDITTGAVVHVRGPELTCVPALVTNNYGDNTGGSVNLVAFLDGTNYGPAGQTKMLIGVQLEKSDSLAEELARPFIWYHRLGSAEHNRNLHDELNPPEDNPYEEDGEIEFAESSSKGGAAR